MPLFGQTAGLRISLVNFDPSCGRGSSQLWRFISTTSSKILETLPLPILLICHSVWVSMIQNAEESVRVHNSLCSLFPVGLKGVPKMAPAAILL